jgi:hypothetical protein
MDRRKGGGDKSFYPIVLKDVEADDDSDDDDTNGKKVKYNIPMSTWAGIWMSAAILLTFIIVLATKFDIIHIALSHESTFHINHIPENHLDTVLSRATIAPLISSVTPKIPIQSKPIKEADHQPQVQKQAILQSNVVPETTRLRKEILPLDKVDISVLQVKVKSQIDAIHKLKFQDHVIMEQDETAKREISVLQNLLREYVPLKYGAEPYRVEMLLKFPEVMHENGRQDEEKVIFELGPLELVPYSTYKFLEIIDSFKGGAFHRRAGHVLQAMVTTDARHLAFQEYHPGFPHVKHTLGYAGRPGGPEFYISTVDNTENHGPASQGSKTEADSCFGKIVDGFEVVKRMQKQPGGSKGSGFVSDSNNFIRITALHVRR